MKSSRPKVMHELAGKPLLQHVVDASRVLAAEQIIVVVGHAADQVKVAMADSSLDYVEQHEQLGTGHAVIQCLSSIKSDNDVLVLFGDVPLIETTTLSRLIAEADDSALAILSFKADNPFGYGRVIRDDDDKLYAIVEHKDADETQLKVNECNAGTTFVRGHKLRGLIEQLDNHNAQGEYYLTDLVAAAVKAGESVVAMICEDADEVRGVNDQQQLAEVESHYRKRQAKALMAQGVKLFDPSRIDIRGDLTVGNDVEIDVNCVFEGSVTLADKVRIGANCVIRNSKIDSESEIKPFTWIDGAVIGRQVRIGPFARIRSGTECADSIKIGNFVETKKAKIGDNSKISHLSYIGDAEIGRDVNIGAGTITCNYDGTNKFKTIIEDGVFIGSNTQLIAPVRIARNATIGAGSIITKDAPAEKLTLSRSKQSTLDGWTRPKKSKDK